MNTEELKALPDDSFVIVDDGGMKARMFPIVSESDVPNAIAHWGNYKGQVSFQGFQDKLTGVAKARGFYRALPDSWKMQDSIAGQGSYIKASMQEGVLDVLGAPFGGPNRNSDNSGERFTSQTNFHESIIPNPVVIYFHGMDEAGRAQETPTVIGQVIKRWSDSAGHWFKVQLDMTGKYGRRVWNAAKEGRAAASTGVVPAYKRVDDGGNISSWLVGELSLLDVGNGRKPVNGYAIAVPAMKANYAKAGMAFPGVLEQELISSVGSNDCRTPQVLDGAQAPCGMLNALSYVPVTGVCAVEAVNCAPDKDPVFDDVYLLKASGNKMKNNSMENVISGLLSMLWKAKGLTDERIEGLLKAVFDPPATPLVGTGDLDHPNNVTTHGVVTPQQGAQIVAAHASSTARVQAQTLPPPAENQQSFVLDPAFVQGVARGTNMGVMPPSQPTLTQAGMYGHGIDTSNAIKAQMDAIQSENNTLKAQVLGEQAAGWVRDMVNTGRVLPAEADGHKAMYVRLASADSLMKAEGAESALGGFKLMVQSRAPQLIITPGAGMQMAGFGTPVGAGGEGPMSSERKDSLLGMTTFGQSIIKKN